MKRIVSLILVCVLSLTIMPQSNAVTQRELNEENATLYNTEMITYFEQEVGYPSHYGGAWLNQNSGHMVIGLTERNATIEQYYYDVTGADVLEFETVEYSLQELHDAILDTGNTLQVMPDAPKMVGNAIIQHTNSVEVYVDKMSTSTYVRNCDAGMLPEFDFANDVEHSDIVEFKVAGKFIPESSTVGQLGYGFKVRTYSNPNTFDGSIGYLAFRTNEQGIRETGFVTAGHTYGRYQTIPLYAFSLSDEVFGDKSFLAYPSSQPTTVDDMGIGDYVFISVRDGYTVSPTIQYDPAYSQDMNIRYVIPAENSTIYMSGHSTKTVSGGNSGEVLSLYYVSISDPEADVPTIRRIKTDYISSPGDSGGIVYTRNSGNKARVVGIHQGEMVLGNQSAVLAIPAFHIQNPENWKNIGKAESEYEDTYFYEHIYAGQ